ncbi:MAG: ABC transporter permease [Thermoleophilia bacterium]|nr:ABC transporter permease [Thermoleophilia bacterium]
MTLALQTIISMAILAAVYILMGLGFAFILNLLGIFNLAHGSIFMLGGYVCYTLIKGAHLNNWVALPITIIVCGVFGILVERFLFRPFKGEFNRTTMVCIAISTILVTTSNLRAGTKQLAIPPFIPGTTGIGPLRVQMDQLFAFGLGLAVLALIMVFVKRSKWGAQMQAITQNREGAALQGIRFGRIAASACGVGFALAGLAGIFMGTLYYLSPFMGDAALVKVLMLVILAGLGSFGGIFVVGGILGAMYAGLPVVLPGAVVDATASILVLALLLIKPQGFFGHELTATPTSTGQEELEGIQRGQQAVLGRSAWTKYVTLGIVLVLVALLPAVIKSGYWLHILIQAFLYTVVASSFRAISISGQFSIAHAAFFGIGAFGTALPSRWLGWSPWGTLIIGGIAAAVLGGLLAFPFARLRTIYYAMGTLFLGVVIINLLGAGGKWTGSFSGLTGLKPLFGSRLTYYYFILAFLILSLIALRRFEFSRIGVTLSAVAQSHEVASSVGINERRYRILAVVFGCFFAGLAGALYAHYNMAAPTTSFGLANTLWIIMYVLVGGINNFWGPSVGVLVLLILPEFFRDLKGYLPYVSAVILLVIAFTLPEGLASLPGLIKQKLMGKPPAAMAGGRSGHKSLARESL